MSLTGSDGPSITYKYPYIVPERQGENIVALTPRVGATNPFSHSPLDLAVLRGRFQHLVPTVRATKKHPAMAPKRATSKAAASIDDATKAALLAEKKGKALTDNTPHEAFEDDVVNCK
jgi:hypothetical protein